MKQGKAGKSGSTPQAHQTNCDQLSYRIIVLQEKEGKSELKEVRRIPALAKTQYMGPARREQDPAHLEQDPAKGNQLAFLQHWMTKSRRGEKSAVKKTVLNRTQPMSNRTQQPRAQLRKGPKMAHDLLERVCKSVIKAKLEDEASNGKKSDKPTKIAEMKTSQPRLQK